MLNLLNEHIVLNKKVKKSRKKKNSHLLQPEMSSNALSSVGIFSLNNSPSATPKFTNKRRSASTYFGQPDPY